MIGAVNEHSRLMEVISMVESATCPWYENTLLRSTIASSVRMVESAANETVNMRVSFNAHTQTALSPNKLVVFASNICAQLLSVNATMFGISALLASMSSSKYEHDQNAVMLSAAVVGTGVVGSEVDGSIVDGSALVGSIVEGCVGSGVYSALDRSQVAKHVGAEGSLPPKMYRYSSIQTASAPSRRDCMSKSLVMLSSVVSNTEIDSSLYFQYPPKM